MNFLERLCLDGARSWDSAEAADYGLSRWTLWRAGRRGDLRRLSRGLYGTDALIDDDATAAAFACRGVISHQTAARHWRIELVDADDQAIHITVGRDRSRLMAADVTIHRADLSPTDVDLGPLPVTTPLRTVLDLARTLPLAQAVASADSAVRHGLVNVGQLRSAALRARGTGARKMRRVAELLDGRCESVLESLLRVMLVEAALAPDESQVVIRDRAGHFVGRVDLWYAIGLVVEADGFAFHSERADYRRDRRMANALEVLGVGLLRFTWEDIVHDPEYVVATVRDVLDDTQCHSMCSVA